MKELIVKDICPGRFRIVGGMSGSSQFTPSQWESYEQRITGENIIVVDLRQESHLFCDDISISFYTKHWESNKNFTCAQAMEKEELYKKDLSERCELEVFHRPDKKTLYPRQNLFRVYNNPYLQTQEEFLKNRGIGYKRFAIEDTRFPDEASLRKFISWLKSLPPNTWLHFHCSAGHGRTTLMMIIWDMLKTKAKFSFKDYVKRQIDAGGVDISKLNEKRFHLRQRRLQFLKKFYSDLKKGRYSF